MVTELFLTLRPHCLPLCTISSKFPILSSSLTISSYGPSLRKGSSIPQSQQPPLTKPSHDDDYSLNEDGFVRIFDIAALRVPSKDCFALERRLRGHLLNWPRIPNIARVPGDDVVDDFAELVRNPNGEEEDEDEDDLVSVNRRLYGKAEGDGEPLSPVLYREKLVKTFNSRGFVNFRNLARMSRPSRTKTKKMKMKMKTKMQEERREGNKRIGRNGLALVEVVEDEEQEGEDMKGLLGDEFVGKKWRGSTRLLLLDERLANKTVELFPEAIKVAIPTL